MNQIVAVPSLSPEGVLVWHVFGSDESDRGKVDQYGMYIVLEDASESTKAVTKAFAEWYRTDFAEYGGDNAAKIKRELLGR